MAPTDPAGPHMTVGDLLDRLERYDRDRLVVLNVPAGGQTVVKAAVSVEPGGAVLLVGDPTLYADAIDASVQVSTSYARWAGSE